MTAHAIFRRRCRIRREKILARMRASRIKTAEAPPWTQTSKNGRMTSR
jgi:hypothetical protein